MWVINGPERVGENFVALGGVFTGTYIGGGVNFNTLALQYDIVEDGVLYGGAVAVDNIMTALWMMVCIALPRFLGALWLRRASTESGTSFEAPHTEARHDEERISLLDLSILLALGFIALGAARLGSAWLASMGYSIPAIILISIFALFLAQAPAIQRIHGAQVLGYFAVTLFLAVIGAFCDLSALQSLGHLGVTLFADMIIDNFDEMRLQTRAQPLVMGIALHAYIVGQPFRLRHLRRALQHIAVHQGDDVWLTTAGAIADHVERLPATILAPPA
jgi:uncharacterized membrane protein